MHLLSTYLFRLPLRFPLTVLVAIALLALPGCSNPEPAPNPESVPSAAAEEALPDTPEFQSDLPESVRNIIDQSFTGDFDAMVSRRLIRAGVTFNRTHYFVDKGTPRGLAYDYLTQFENDLNTRLKTGNLKIHVVFVPLPRDLLLPALVAGKIDLVVAQLTVTPEREKIVDFTAATREGVSEVVVSGPGAPAIARVEDLAGQEVFVRKSSSYYQSLLALNDRLKTQGKAPVQIVAAAENLEDDDLLEMVNAGLVGITVVDDYVASFWKQVFTDLRIAPGAAVRTGGHLAVAIRKNSPQLAATANDFIRRFGGQSAFANMMDKRYLQSTKYVRNAASEEERRKFLALVELFKKYSEQYKLDYLLMGAQGYQESRLDQNARSQVGAIGVMQVMPATAKDLNVGDINELEANVHAGVKYMRFMIDRYYKDEPMDELNKGLFTFASYNAGPGRVRQLRREAEKRGLDPNVWFGSVERVASERIGRETVTYVSNIYKYYVAYKLITEEQQRRAEAKKAIK